MSDGIFDERNCGVLANSVNQVPNSLATKTGLGLFAGALLIRVVFLFVTPNNGVDSLARYTHAVDWLKDPASLPSATSSFAWLPLHFWLLGGAIWLWNSEWSARILTLLLGALTILPYWGAMRRAFEFRVALAASVAFAIFGFHVGYSVTTSSEVPTVFFVTMGLYCWARFYSEPTWRWALVSGLFLSAACLCRFEPWLVPPVLAFALLNHSDGWRSLWSDRRSWWNAARFAVPASAGPIGWMLFSWMRWGDPMMLPHRTIATNVSDLGLLRPALPLLLTLVPLELMGSLSPLIVVLAAIGLVMVLRRRTVLAKGLALLTITLLLFNYYFAVRFLGYQGKYTLLYCWLLPPFAFLALPWATSRLPTWTNRSAPWFAIFFFVLWQAGIVFGSIFASPPFADDLTYISVTLPPRAEVRRLDAWLKLHRSASDAVIIDDDNEGAYIVGFSGIDPAMAFSADRIDDRDPKSTHQIGDFIRERRPSLLLCSSHGPMGRGLSNCSQEYLEIPSLDLYLHRIWQGDLWMVYAVKKSR